MGRTMGTDAFSRIRSRSIQNKKCNNKYVKTANDVCPFWNPFEASPHCPYHSISVNGKCSLLHLSKTAYLDRLSEDDSIELLTLLFTDSLFVEACVVIEKLLELNPENDEYN